MEPTLTVGGQPIKRKSAVYRAAKRFVEQHLDCRHLEVGDEHPLDGAPRMAAEGGDVGKTVPPDRLNS